MSTYALLSKWTQEGITNVKNSPNRLDELKVAWKEFGAEFVSFYGVVGQYNMLIIFEAPNNEIAWRVALHQSEGGALRSEVLVLQTEGEYRKVIAGL